MFWADILLLFVTQFDDSSHCFNFDKFRATAPSTLLTQSFLILLTYYTIVCYALAEPFAKTWCTCSFLRTNVHTPTNSATNSKNTVCWPSAVCSFKSVQGQKERFEIKFLESPSRCLSNLPCYFTFESLSVILLPKSLQLILAISAAPTYYTNP